MLLQDALDDTTTQQQVVNSLPRTVQSRIMRFEGKRIVLFPQRLHGVMRAALLSAHRGASPDDLADHAEDVALAILEADALISMLTTAGRTRRESGRSSLARSCA